MEQEFEYSDALLRVTAFEIRSDVLRLLNDDGREILKFTVDG